MAAVLFHIDAHEIAGLADAWARTPGIVAEEMARAVEEGTQRTLREVQERTPVGATSMLRESIAARPVAVTGDAVTGAVSTSVRHAVPVEIGTKPHRPPVEPLADWAKARLGLSDREARRAAWAIAARIAARGTEGAFMFRGGLDAAKPHIERLFNMAARRALARIAQEAKP